MFRFTTFVNWCDFLWEYVDNLEKYLLFHKFTSLIVIGILKK